MAEFRDYANLTEEQRQAIIKAYRGAKERGASDPGHAAAIACCEALNISDRAWAGKKGANAFAAALAVLVMRKEITLTW